MWGFARPAPIISGGSSGGGGGSGISPVFLSGEVSAVPSSDSANLDIALPGVTRCVVLWAQVSLTAGASGQVAVGLYADNDRSGSPEPAWIFGSAFGSSDPGSFGPQSISGSTDYRCVPYLNVDEEEFLRLLVKNNDFSEVGSFRVDLIILPLPALTGET